MTDFGLDLLTGDFGLDYLDKCLGEERFSPTSVVWPLCSPVHLPAVPAPPLHIAADEHPKVARSLAEPSSSSSAAANDSSKYRQLPCRTFISVGTCPYRERCVYLHDPRVLCREAKSKTRKKNKEDSSIDSLFWPVMPQHSVYQRVDGNGHPHVIQQYCVPAPQNDEFQYHDEAVFSLWNHFVELCMKVKDYFDQFDSNERLNRFTKKKRLSTFLSLSRRESLGAQPSPERACSRRAPERWFVPIPAETGVKPAVTHEPIALQLSPFTPSCFSETLPPKISVPSARALLPDLTQIESEMLCCLEKLERLEKLKLLRERLLRLPAPQPLYFFGETI